MKTTNLDTSFKDFTSKGSKEMDWELVGNMGEKKLYYHHYYYMLGDVMTCLSASGNDPVEKYKLMMW